MFSVMFATALAAGQPAVRAPVLTQDAAPSLAANVDANLEAVAAARELFASLDHVRQIRQSLRDEVNVMLTAVVQACAARGTPVSADAEREFRERMLRGADILGQELERSGVDEMAAAYARHFTAEELRELTRLQSHPVMAKLNRLTPTLSVEMAQIVAGAVTRRLPELQQVAERELERALAATPVQPAA